MKRLSTGIDYLDKIIDGGIPAGYNIIVLGEPGTKKSLFSQHIAYEHLKNEGSVLFILTNRSTDDLLKEISELKWKNLMNYANEGRLKVLDLYSEDSKKQGISVENLTKVAIEIEERRKNLQMHGPVLEIFDSASRFFPNAYSKKEIIQFLENACLRAKSSGTIVLFNIEEGMHNRDELSTLEAFTEGTIMLKKTENNRQIKVKKMMDVDYPTDWFDIDLTKKGIKIKKPFPLKKILKKKR